MELACGSFSVGLGGSAQAFEAALRWSSLRHGTFQNPDTVTGAVQFLAQNA